MKNILLVAFIAAGSTQNVNAQNVNIPDVNFKAYLVGNPAINTNADPEIQVGEAAAFSGTINCGYLNIADLTGIEAFTALTVLRCESNQLTVLDLSSNTALTKLDCRQNHQLANLNVSNNAALKDLYCGMTSLTSIDVSNNTNLETLYCIGCPLTVLDVSSNTALTALYCESSQLTVLDLSNNTMLTTLYCHQTKLTTLDLSANAALTFLDCGYNKLVNLNVRNGNNMNLTYFHAQGNDSLTCVQVDSPAYFTAHWGFGAPLGTAFSENCLGTASIGSTLEKKKFAVYPNPARDAVYISVPVNARLTSAMGQIISNQKSVNRLDLSNQPAGIYFLTLTDSNGQVVQQDKIVKE